MGQNTEITSNACLISEKTALLMITHGKKETQNFCAYKSFTYIRSFDPKLKVQYS